MARSKISDEVVTNVLRLSEQKRDAAEIAREVALSRMEVAAIIAHVRSREPRAQPAVEPRTITPQPRDLWLDTISSRPVTTSIEPERDGREQWRGDEDEEEGIFVGEEAEYDDVPINWDPANARHVQNPHLMIMGESGSGKTYAQQCLVAELAHAGIPSIVFDYGQSFEGETLDRAFVKHCNPKEYLVGEEGLALNPLQIFDRDSKGPYTVATRLADVFDAAFRLGDIQRKVLIEAILLSYKRAGISIDETESWRKVPPSILVLRDAIDELAADRQGYAYYKNAAGLSARLTTFFMLSSFSTSEGEWSWDKLMRDEDSRVHILQFRGLEGKTQRVLVEVLLWHLFSYLRVNGQSVLHVFCVLDEAHHLSFRESGPVNALLREARKFGIGVIFASQQPEDFSPVAYSNSASKLIFQTSDPNLKVSRYLAGKVTNFERPEEVRSIISDLPQGFAFFITKNRGHVIRIADFSKRATMWRRK